MKDYQIPDIAISPANTPDAPLPHQPKTPNKPYSHHPLPSESTHQSLQQGLLTHIDHIGPCPCEICLRTLHCKEQPGWSPDPNDIQLKDLETRKEWLAS
jgi:hypothetical protein